MRTKIVIILSIIILVISFMCYTLLNSNKNLKALNSEIKKQNSELTKNVNELKRQNKVFNDSLIFYKMKFLTNTANYKAKKIKIKL